ncbi:unnamed protein product [Clonostachys rosea]|uniref:Uncharacterized protein n=1 Tax=Bionectria ochroleuca TaxID=29856 RepID=A0ABY6UYG0_BIOOC|nr:unnamed protein product [Clonostachys rosea]
MPSSSHLLYPAVGLLMVVAIIELAFVSATVGFLHGPASGTFPFNSDGSTIDLRGEPKNLMTDQGHTSNAAAGTAFILIGLGGSLALFLRSRPNPSKFAIFFYHLWVLVNVLSFLLTFGALVYVFVVTNRYAGQTIDAAVAARLGGEKYDVGTWTPQGWFSALLELDLVNSSDRSKISTIVHITRGWQYNLIPFFIIQLVETSIAVWDALQRRKVVSPTDSAEKVTA